jgi:lysophospholipase
VYVNNENSLASYYQNELAAFISEQLIVGYYQRADGASLHYRYVINSEAKAWIVIAQGRAESVVKYAEVIDELYRNGFSVFAFDYIGQGQSSRLTVNPMQGFIEDFNDYVSDSAALIDEVMLPLKQQHKQQNLPQHLLCHSMGSAIGSLFLIKHPSVFSKAILLAPMYGIKSPLPAFIAKGLVDIGASIHRFLGIRSGYFLGQGDFQKVSFAQNKLTSSEARYHWFQQYYSDNIDARLGGVTFQWLAAALRAMDSIERDAHTIDARVLIIKAAADDIVDNQAIDRVYAKIPHAQLVEISGAKHEILFERDCYRSVAVRRILQFIVD